MSGFSFGLIFCNKLTNSCSTLTWEGVQLDSLFSFRAISPKMNALEETSLIEFVTLPVTHTTIHIIYLNNT